MILQGIQWLWKNHCALKDLWLDSSGQKSLNRGQHQQTCQGVEERRFDENETVKLLHDEEDSKAGDVVVSGLFLMTRYIPFFLPLSLLSWVDIVILSCPIPSDPASEARVPRIHPRSKSGPIDVSIGVLCAICQWTRVVTVMVIVTSVSSYCGKSEEWRDEGFLEFLLSEGETPLDEESMRSRDFFSLSFLASGASGSSPSQMYQKRLELDNLEA